MASENNLTAVFTDIANAIRDKKGSVDTIKPINMADEILTIETGSSEKSTIYKLLETMGTNWSHAFRVDSSNRNMFYYMTELSENDFPPSNNVVSMYCMFYYNHSLTTIPKLDTSKVSDMDYMFYYCIKLEKIDITKLASNNNRFATSCSSLKTLVIRTMDTIPTLNSNAFDSCYHFYGTTNATYNPNGLKDGRIYVPDDKVEELKVATNWSVFADIIKPLSEYTGE